MNKKNLILGGVLAGLIVLAYVYQGPLKQWQAKIGQPDNFMAQASLDEIDTIDIAGPFGQTTLHKSGERWKIAGTKDFYVKPETAEQMVAEWRKAVAAELELVSENKDRQSEFEVGAAGTRVVMRQGDQTAVDMTIGKTGGDFVSTYVSPRDSDKTYAVKAGLNSVFVRSDWHDKTVFAFDGGKVDKIRFQFPTSEFTVEAAIKNSDDNDDSGDTVEKEWEGILPRRFSVSDEKIDAVLDIMSGLTAVSVPAQTFDNTGLDKSSIIIQATGDGIDETLMIGDKSEDGLFYAKRGSSDNIYLIAEADRDAFNKRMIDLR